MDNKYTYVYTEELKNLLDNKQTESNLVEQSQHDDELVVRLLNEIQGKERKVVFILEHWISEMISNDIAQEAVSPEFSNRLSYYKEHLTYPIDLNISNSNIKDEALLKLKGFPIRQLSLYNCQQLTPKAFLAIQEIPSIRSLKLEGNEWVDDELLTKIPIAIEELSLATCYHFTGRGLSYLESSQVSSLNLFGCYQLTDDDLAHLPDHFDTLDLSLCDGVGKKTVKRLGEMRKLLRLNLMGDAVTDEDIAFLPKQLTGLNLSGCNREGLTDACIDSISQMKALQGLYLSGSQITNKGLPLLPESLVNLYLDRCQGIDDEGIRSLVEHCQNLKLLSLYQTRHITSEVVEALTSSGIEVGWQAPQPSHIIIDAMSA